MHLLPAFAARFGADVSEWLRTGPNRRYGTGLQASASSMVEPDAAQPAARWSLYADPLGRIGLAMPRALVLRLLRCRYGAADAPAAPDLPEALDGPVTASEERLSHKLGLQLVQALARRIDTGMPPPGAAAADTATPALAFVEESALPAGPWQLELELVEPQNDGVHPLRFSLDERWLHRLLDRLSQGRTLAREPAGMPAQPLAHQLKLRLVTRLVQQRLPLGAVLDLQPGSVLPIPQPAAVVLVKESPLFSASVAEHKGRLWLTAFQDL